MNREQHLRAEERTYENVEVTRDGGVFVVKLHRPEKFNALDARLREEVVAAQPYPDLR
jgi:enoyl-CoA hydratase/carnithine racemase